MRQSGHYTKEVYEAFTNVLEKQKAKISSICRKHNITLDEVDTYSNSSDYATVFDVTISLPDVWIKGAFKQPSSISDLPESFVSTAQEAVDEIEKLITRYKDMFIVDDPVFPLSPYSDFELEDEDPHTLLRFEYYNPEEDPSYIDDDEDSLYEDDLEEDPPSEDE